MLVAYILWKDIGPFFLAMCLSDSLRQLQNILKIKRAYLTVSFKFYLLNMVSVTILGRARKGLSIGCCLCATPVNTVM